MDEIAIERRMTGEKGIWLEPDERLELIRRWQESGRSLQECYRVTGINVHREWKNLAARTR